MKKVFLGLLVAGAAFTGSAFTNVNKQVFIYKYGILNSRAAGGIYVENITGLILNTDYTCYASSRVCTFLTDTPITGTDATGKYINPVPVKYGQIVGDYAHIPDDQK